MLLQTCNCPPGNVVSLQNKQFFKLSELEKKSASNSPSQCLHGYSATGDEKIRDKICMKESFDCGNPENNTMQSNNWPPEEHLPGFRNFTEDFFEVLAA